MRTISRSPAWLPVHYLVIDPSKSDNYIWGEKVMSDTWWSLAGGLGGKEFSGYALPPGAKVKEIHVFAGDVIEAIQLIYTGTEGETEGLPRMGALAGNDHVFALEEDEYVTGISGRVGWYVDSLRIHTNQRVSETFGGGGGDHEYVYFAPEGSEVAGLFGRTEVHLEALGILTRGRSSVETKPAAKPKAAKAKSKAEAGPAVAGASEAKEKSKTKGKDKNKKSAKKSGKKAKTDKSAA